MTLGHGGPLTGRAVETRYLDDLVSSLRAGRSRSLVIRGEAGIGKTTLLEYAVERASGCRTVRAIGVESEAELAYAGLHQLCAPLLDHAGSLTAPQAAALGVALGLEPGDAPDRFLIGLAVLNLFSAAADDAPLLCLVDDAQWIDAASRQTLAFVARRLQAESVGLVFAVREPYEDSALARIDDVVVSGLDDEDARAVLGSVLTGPIDVAVRDRIVAESAGNPLAITELTRGLSPAELVGGSTRVSASPVRGRIVDAFQRRIEQLPRPTRQVLTIAAAESVGDPALVLAAAALLDIASEALTPALHGGLVDLGIRLRFRHPLIRTAALQAASPEDVLAAHRALADATDPVTDPDRRAWHRAEAVVGFDEEVAADLVRSARRAQSRGGLAAGAAFHQRAVELTPDPAMRARRALPAAEDKFRAGATADALRLLELAAAEHLDAHENARVELVRARAAHLVTRGKDAPRLLLHAAERLAPHDPEASIALYADAFFASISAGTLAVDVGVDDVARAVLSAHATGINDAAAAAWTTLRCLAALALDGYATAAAPLRRALAALTETVTASIERVAADADARVAFPDAGRVGVEPDEQVARAGADASALSTHRRGLGVDAVREDGLHWLALGTIAARVLGDDAVFDEFTHLQLEYGQRTGALSLLPLAMAERSSVLLWSGRLAAAEALSDAMDPVLELTDAPASMGRTLWVRSFQGDEAAAVPLLAAAREELLRRGEGQRQISIAFSAGILFNALGRYDDAFAWTDAVAGHPFDLGMLLWVLPEHVEAAVRTGNADRAHASVERLTEMAEACGTDWARGVAAVCAALVADDAAAELLYLRAIETIARTGQRLILARAHLVHGEWLRRRGRRTEARAGLRRAHEMFSEMGALGFAERARRELVATGETVHRRGPGPVDELTSQERQIAMLAAGGGTNPEIGSRLFLSPRTVEWHLGKVFAKLGVTSRRQLAVALGER